MRTKPIIVALTLLLLLAFAASAADLAGKWTAQVPGRNAARETVFTFRSEGGALSGTMSAQGRETPLADVKLSGEMLSFTASVERGGNTIKQTYSGHVAGDEIHFKREGGRGPAREFTAKRVK